MRDLGSLLIPFQLREAAFEPVCSVAVLEFPLCYLWVPMRLWVCSVNYNRSQQLRVFSAGALVGDLLAVCVYSGVEAARGRVRGETRPFKMDLSV